MKLTIRRTMKRKKTRAHTPTREKLKLPKRQKNGRSTSESFLAVASRASRQKFLSHHPSLSTTITSHLPHLEVCLDDDVNARVISLLAALHTTPHHTTPHHAHRHPVSHPPIEEAVVAAAARAEARAHHHQHRGRACTRQTRTTGDTRSIGWTFDFVLSC